MGGVAPGRGWVKVGIKKSVIKEHDTKYYVGPRKCGSL